VSAEEKTRIQDLLGDARNADPFRLAILGLAAIEETLDEALADSFGGQLPAELSSTRNRSGESPSLSEPVLL
jgi:hypothetical protein